MTIQVKLELSVCITSLRPPPGCILCQPYSAGGELTLILVLALTLTPASETRGQLQLDSGWGDSQVNEMADSSIPHSTSMMQ